MKKYYVLLFMIATSLTGLACPTCEKAQPPILRGISHGTGPESKWDYAIIWAAVILVIVTLFFSIKWLIRPGEKTPSHIKRIAINFE